MNIKIERLLFILAVTAWLVGLASTGAFAASVSLSVSPTEATANSVWNYAANWSDDEGIWPMIDPNSDTEGLIAVGIIGTFRNPIPAEWADSLNLWPAMPAPDGFPGFQEPAELLPPEAYQPLAYGNVQPNPADLDSPNKWVEADGQAIYDHGLDYVAEYTASDGKAGVPLNDAHKWDAAAAGGLPTPQADGTILCNADPNNPGTKFSEGWVAPGSNPQTPFIVILRNSPVALVGVWKDAMHTQPVKAKIVAANSIVDTWPQKYNVIAITDSKFVAPTRLYIAYYCPGTTYVITKQAPLPLPYTVYTAKLRYADDPYVVINDAIAHLDPGRAGDPTDAATTAADFGVMGVYLTRDLDHASDPNLAINYFDMDAFDVGATRYEITAEGYGKAHFSTPLPANYNKAGQTLFIKVSTNAVDGVWDSQDMSGTNYYQRPDGTVIGYDARGGIIRLGTPLPAPDLADEQNADYGTAVFGKQCFVSVRHLSQSDYTIGRTPNLGYVQAVPDLRPALPPDTKYAYASDKTVIHPGGSFTIGDPLPPFGTYAAQFVYNLRCQVPTVWLNGNIPMNLIDGNGYSSNYRVSVSAGLNMSNPKQQPDVDRSLNTRDLNNKLIYDDYLYPMYYVSSLTGSWPARQVQLTSTGSCIKDGKLVTVSSKATVTVHGSTVVNGGNINYGGGGSLDWLTCYGDGSPPYSGEVDPLAVEPIEEANPTYPDDGSGSTQFVFRVRYHNIDGLPPLPWLPSSADPWVASATGVVLYLDENGTGDYKPHFMQPDYEPGSVDHTCYYYRVLPHNDVRSWGSGNPLPLPFQDSADVSNNLYQSLSMGTYHYFFACSDDSLTFSNGGLALSYQGNPVEWGVGGSATSTGLDPVDPRAIVGYAELDRQPHRRYSSSGTRAFDSELFVDRPCRAPHQFEGPISYPWSCEVHPRVSCELHMPIEGDDFGTRYDDPTYGFGRFFGTLFPYRTAVNPVHPGSRGHGEPALLAETSGSYSKDTNVFRILYKQVDNKAPVSIKLWLNNASEKSGTDAAHTYRAFTMQRRADQINPDYRKGVWYEYKIQSGSSDLPLGPHTYYFTADDGEHVVRWPVRPDHYTVQSPGGTGEYADYWVPTSSLASERRNPGYMDNDYVPGPYVNSAPAITNVSVTPGTAKEGARFLYRATYSDADGQRIYSANITIEVNDRGDRRTFAMVPDPAQNIDPNADNSALYKSGVNFILDTGTIKDLALEKGVRRFFVEFTDDWGRQDDVNDLRKGETVRYPAGTGNWVSGPVISGNTPPTLSGGSVTSLDGTANAATLWTFSVKYRDVNNDPPQVIKLFIGELQSLDSRLPIAASKVKTIIWDSGHTMVQSDPSDKVYSDGAEYYFQTRLGGPDVGASAKQYYYAFEAYDGIDYATYKNSSRDDQRSDAAGCFVQQQAECTDAAGSDVLHYKIRTKIARQLTLTAPAAQINPDPDNVGDVVRIWGVYTNEDLTGTNYYDSGGAVPPDYVYNAGQPTQIALTTSPVPAGKIWVLMEAETPIIGPLPVGYPSPAGVIPDAEVFINAATTGVPVNLTCEKNGYVQDPNDPAYVAPGDRAWLQMLGVASYEGVASGNYVAPDYPDQIASVEGVYWLDDPVEARRSQNYFEPKNHTNLDGKPDGLEPPVVRQGTLAADPVGTLPGDKYKRVTLTMPEEADKILGVYDNPQLTGINYYQGGGLPVSQDPNVTPVLKWQEAWIMGPDPSLAPANDPAWPPGPTVIWPSKPNDIAVIAGVYATLNSQDAQGNFLPPDAAGAPKPYVVEGLFDAASGNVIVDPVNDIENMISTVYTVTEKSPLDGDPGTVYFSDAAGVAFNHVTRSIALAGPGLPADGAVVYVSYRPASDVGPNGEFIAVKKPLHLTSGVVVQINGRNVGYRMFIAYYAPGDLDSANQVRLAIPFKDAGGAPLPTPYVKIWPKAFTAGDRYIKLSTRLPDLPACGTVVNATTVAPRDASILPLIGKVTGVYITADCSAFDPTSIDPALTNYYAGTLNPFTPWGTTNSGDTVINLGKALPNPLGGQVVITYVPKQRNVVILYDDLRFTRQMTGTVSQVAAASYNMVSKRPVITKTGGTTFFVPDASNRSIVGNSSVANLADPNSPTVRDIDGGVVGIWEKSDLSGVNYFNPRKINRFQDNFTTTGFNPGMLRMSTEAPIGTSVLYAQAYQKGVYFIDRWNRNIRFDKNSLTPALTETDRVQVSYFFGTKMPKTLVANTLPTLTEGKVTPITGSRNTQYVYSVKYTDIDGPNGQMPSYVRVYIDGVPYDMASAVQGTPVYKSGAVYTFTPPNGLAGGSHTYHFEASDGAAIAWFDGAAPYSHQTERGQSTLDIAEIDGPWVNDPPLLSNGLVNPNPIPGGITTSDSVDYFVTLKDVDNDPPYVFDPLRDSTGGDVSGSPRVWVDAGINDDTAAPTIGTIVGIEPDPLENSKQRVIVVKVDDGNGNLIDPSWTTDQFAGKLMQITNGDTWSDIYPSPYLRVYLIQSNTANKIVLATDDLASDQLLVSADPATGAARYTKFRVNGLLMTKVDPTQQNFALGIDYKVTVPRLAVGNHKFHFTARTRETKPNWLLLMSSYSNKAPYSSMARFPSLGDSTGPTVVSVTPPGNRPPDLSRSGTSTLYRGPQAQKGTVTSPTTVTPSNYNVLLSVAGVYRNANFDAHLPANQQINYLDVAAVNPPATGDPIRLNPMLAKTPDTADLIQHGSVVNLVTVRPDVPAAVGSVTAVYLAKDTTLAAGYAPAAGALNADNTVTLLSPLPAGSTDVYIKYKPATAIQTGAADATGDNVIPTSPNAIGYVVSVVPQAGGGNIADTALWTPGSPTIPLLGSVAPGTAVNITYVPWPPVYVKYFAVEPTSAPKTTPVTHGIFTAGEPLTFRIFYRDLDGHRPSYHDGVQGYVKLVFNDSGRSAQLLAASPVSDYMVGAPFAVTLTDVPEGTHPYHFEASDGYVVTRYPVDPVGSGANDEKVQVNYKPLLKSGNVDHTSGATTFTFSVTYSDKDNIAPLAGGFVQVVLTNQADPTKTLRVQMTTNDPAPAYSSGVRYTGVAAAKDGNGNVILPSGTYNTVFVANDGVQDADPLNGPTIVVRDTNAAPIIVDYEVKKLLSDGTLGNGAGKTTDTFVYRAWYKDADNDAPVAVFNGIRQTALTLIVDKGTTTEQRFPMTMVPLTQPAPPAPPVLPDYTGGDASRWPEWQARVTGKKLGGGNHTYTVVANDGTLDSVYNTDPVIPVLKYGPVLMIPYFQLEVVGRDGEPITGRSIVGQEVLIQGQLIFPYTTPDEQPNGINNIVITVTKPDATTVSLKADLTIIVTSGTPAANWMGDIQTYYFSQADPTLVTGDSVTLTASGQWKINATWPGNSLYDGTETDAVIDGHNDQVRIDVSAPSMTVAVLNPLAPETSAPLANMICPPMYIGATNPGGIFGYSYALPMQIVRWSPSSGQYFWYNVGGVFPALKPGDAMWIKPKLPDATQPGSGYPAAEPLGPTNVGAAVPSTDSLVPIGFYASHINGVYLNSAKTGASYYTHSLAAIPFKAGDTQIALTTPLPAGTTQVWVDYVGSQSAVDEGWIALDSPSVQRAVVAGDPRYMHTKYRLIKVLAQAYPLMVDASGKPVLDSVTKLPLLKTCSVPLSTGWNQFGNIFFNWKKTWQAGTPAPGEGFPPPPPGSSDLTKVVPTSPNSIGKLLGVYLSASADIRTATNYYQPGVATTPYRRGDAEINLTTPLPAGTTTVYLRYEAYPREDLGLAFSEVKVSYLGVTKTLADAKAAGWITDYAWRYDPVARNYVMVSATAAGAERVLKAWSGYWIKAYVNCQLEINPNPSAGTNYSGVLSVSKEEQTPTTSSEDLEMPPPAPQ